MDARRDRTLWSSRFEILKDEVNSAMSPTATWKLDQRELDMYHGREIAVRCNERAVANLYCWIRLASI